MVNALHKSICTFVLFCFVCSVQSNAKTANAETSNKKSATYFIENKGQITDQDHRYRKDIDFKLPATGGLNLFIGSGHMHYMWSTCITDAKDGEELTVNKIATYRVDVELVGANKNVQPETFEKGTYYERYYTSEVHDAVAYTYGKVIYRNIYPNIDWVLYTQNGGLKYDFIVRPGGNVDDIKIEYKGTDEISLRNGALHIATPYGTVTEQAPYTYQSYIKKGIESAYVLEGNVLSFDVAEYEGQIVIDPSLEWATYMGGSSQEYSYGIATDTGKNVYIVGRSESQTSNVATTLAFQDTLTGLFDGFIVKYAPGGARQWGTYYGGDESDVINSIVVNGDNDIVFAGVTDTSFNLFVPSAHQATHGGGNTDAFLGKMNASGQLQWASYYGGAGEERYLGFDFQVSVTCDAANNIYLAGLTSSDTGIHTNGTAQTSRAGGYDGFVAKFNKQGLRQWGTYYGGTYDDIFNNISTSSNGFVYVAGDFKSSSMGTNNTFSSNRRSSNNVASNSREPDILIAKFNPNTGARIWATYYGGIGTGVDNARGIVVGDSSNFYVSGSTENSSGIASGVGQSVHGGGYDAFLLKMDSTGNRLWCTYAGGSGADQAGNVVLDDNGNPNFTARTASANNIATPDGHKISKNGSDWDAALIIFDKSGGKTWGTYYGNNGNNDYGYGVATAGDNHIYFCGNTESATGIWLSGYQDTLGGSTDAFLAKFTPDTSSFIFQPFTQTVHCQGDSFTLNYGVTATFQPSNTFTVQLSNSSGSFSSPINIGTVNTSTGGTVKVGVPSNVSGTGFRIRVVGTAPLDTSYDNGVDINIKALPAKPVASNNGPVCSNDTLKLSSTPYVNGVTYNWTGPVAFSKTSTSSANSFRTGMNSNMSGDYIIVADNNGCSRSDTTTAVIIQAATKPDLVTNGPLCSGDDLNLTSNNTKQGDSAVFTGPGSWSSTFSGPIVATTTPNAVIANTSASNAGTYYVTVWMNGCQSKDTTSVTIGTKPNPVNMSTNSPICSNDSITVSGGSSSAGVAHNIYGPGGFTRYNVSLPYKIGGRLPTHSGDYILEADLAGCRVRDTANVTIKQSPTKPEIGIYKYPECQGDSLILEARYIDTPGTMIWNGPGGFSSVDTVVVRPSFQLNMNGDYYLINTLSNGCTASDTLNITTKAYTPLNITAVIKPGSLVCPGADVKFEIQNAGSYPLKDYAYKWQLDSGLSYKDTSYPAQRPNIKKTDAGIYNLQVTSRTDKCEYGRDTFNLAVVDTISPPVLNLQSTYCANDTIHINPVHPYLTSYTLTYPKGTTQSFTDTMFYTLNKADHEGRYIIRVDAGGNCKASDTAFVTDIKPIPLKPSSQVVPTLCDGDELKLSTTSTTPGVGYEWRGPSGYTSTMQNPTISSVSKAVHEGYFRAYAVLNGCLSYPDSVQVSIRENPAPEVADIVVCEGGQILLEVVNDTSNIQYNWSTTNNNGFTATGVQAILNDVKLTDGGGYVVTASEDLTGCVGTDTAYVSITPLPGKMDVSYNGPLCEGQDLIFTVNDTSTNVSYAWTGPGSFTYFDKDASRIQVNQSQAGRYVISAARGSCSRSDSIQVDVKQAPAVPQLTNNGPLTAGQELQLTVLNPTPGASFEWKGPSNYGSRIQDPIITNVIPKQAGTYSLTTTLDGCSSSGITIVVIRAGEGKTEEIILYPNPNNGEFTVTANLAFDQTMPYEVVTASGRIVHRDVVTSQDQKIEEKVSIKDVLPSGYYIFRIMMSGESREVPFSIVR